jgi:hypothetical protein
LNTPSHVGISLFCICIIYFLWGWNLPDGRFSRHLLKKITKPVIWLGLNHSWSMFAPRPITTDEVIRFIITFEDKSSVEVPVDYFPSPGKQNFSGDVRHLKLMHALVAPTQTFIQRCYAEHLIFLHETTWGIDDMRKIEKIEYLLTRSHRPTWKNVDILQTAEQEIAVFTFFKDQA